MTKLQIVLLLTTLMGSFNIITGEKKCNSSNCMYDRMLETVGKEFIEQCFKETGVTPEDIRSVMEQNGYGEKQIVFPKMLDKENWYFGKRWSNQYRLY
uniref:Odorant binding protein 9 n=1 Tax=Ips typographus TaxID=55986 RepID=M3TYY4_IPSTY